MRSVCAAALLCLVAAVAWHHRHNPRLQGWLALWHQPADSVVVAPSAEPVQAAGPCPAAEARCPQPAPVAALLRSVETKAPSVVRKCVSDTSVLYTDEHCPHDHRPMAMTGGTFNVVSGRSTAAEPPADEPILGGLPQRAMQLAARF